MIKNLKGLFAPAPDEVKNQVLLEMIDDIITSANKLFDDIARLLLYLKQAPDIRYPVEFIQTHTNMMTFADNLQKFLMEQKDGFYSNLK